VNLSPKGLDALRVLGSGAVCYLDRTGSGNETAAHLQAHGRLTIMLCAFEGAPLILRLYGQGRVHLRGRADHAPLLAGALAGAEPPGARQIVELAIDLVQTSCGYGVPEYGYQGERAILARFAEARGEDRMKAYWREKNAGSIDGLPTPFVSSGEVDAWAVGGSAKHTNLSVSFTQPLGRRNHAKLPLHQ